MKLLRISHLSICLSLFLFSIQITAQETPDSLSGLRMDAVRVFIDCRGCDMNYIREEIPYVNYVRDVRESEVYILETRQNTGSGGSEYTFTFLGQEQYKGMNDTLTYSTRPDDTRDFIREGRTQMIRMGLMRYVAKTSVSKDVIIRHGEEIKKQEVKDRWNYWVFELETRPRIELEESLREVTLRNSINITKITPDWKIEVEYDHSYNRTKYLEDDTTYTWIRKSQSLDNLIVKSLTEHWSTGLVFDISQSTYGNLQFNYSVLPSLEYNIFPYSESTRRQLRLLYSVGYVYNAYNDTTIYDKLVENLFQQQLQVAFQVQQKWGSVNISLEASNYFHDFSKNRIELDGFIRIRIFKGLSFQLNGSVARIRNQLALVKGEASAADILLRLRQLATGYTVEGSLGITYTFGSIYNNIVNPRFGNGGGYNRY